MVVVDALKDALWLVACASPREPVPRSMLAAAQHAAAAESTAAARALLGVKDPDPVLLPAVAVDLGVWTELMKSLPLLLMLPLFGSTCALTGLFISAWGWYSHASSGARSSFGILTVCLGLGSGSPSVCAIPLPFRFLCPSTSWVRGLRQRASSAASAPDDMRLILLSMIGAIFFCDRLNRDSAAWIHYTSHQVLRREIFKKTNCREEGGFLYGGLGLSFGCGCTTAGPHVAPLLHLARSELPLLIAVAI